MFRTLVPRRPFATAALLGTFGGFAGLAASATPARAQAPVTIGFNSIATPSDFNFVSNCYQESGFQVRALGLACTGAGTSDAFAAYGPTAGGAYTGSPALFLNTNLVDTVAISRVNNGAFSMQSISFGPFGGPGSFTTPATFTMFGSLLNGSMVSQVISVLGTGSLQTFTLTGFTGVTSVRFAGFDMYLEPLQFDNIRVTPAATAVPEPTTIALVAGGLLAVGGVARRRRTRPQA